MPRDAISDDITLLETEAEGASVPRSAEISIDARYKVSGVLGRGGMGEVRLARDTRIDREVAVKLMRSSVADDVSIARFFREARIQGVLDHPAVVPVHDLGLGRDGQPYFVMKKLAGRTLADVLAERSVADDDLGQAWRRRVLLPRVVDVALAVAFAHARDIVHRDIKPANIMLGDYGETYLLDWGVAKLVGEPSAPVNAEDTPDVIGTAVGSMLGTLGYMAPEQARGENVDARADVFSLGCVLYEVLAGVPALPRGPAALEPTLTADEHRPSARAEVPPELDELCARATARDRARRPSARELADSIQAYLHGDRDVAHRKSLALAHVARATEALEQPGDQARATAMREAGRGFVLDPDNTVAQDVLAGLVLEAPAVAPAEALAAVTAERAKTRATVLKRATLTYLGLVPVIGSLFLLPIRVAWPLVATLTLCGVMAGACWVASRHLLAERAAAIYLLFGLNCTILTCGTFIFGPLLIAPMFVVGALAGVASIPTGLSPPVLIAGHALPLAIPLALEVSGVTPSSFAIVDGSFVLTPIAIEFTPITAGVVYGIILTMRYLNTTAIAFSVRKTSERALERVHVQSWHLRKLLPDVTQSRISAVDLDDGVRTDQPQAGRRSGSR